MKKLYLLLAAHLIALSSVYAESKPFQLSLTPEIALQERDTLIEGLSLNIWGENEQRAIAFGLVNGSYGSSVGVSLGGLNYAEDYKGIHLGLANYAGGQFSGAQVGWFFGFSGINYAYSLTGLQLGLVNYAETAENGIQIGLINIMNETPGWFDGFPTDVAPAMILLNWRF
jgi:hypothetical protein